MHSRQLNTTIFTLSTLIQSAGPDGHVKYDGSEEAVKSCLWNTVLWERLHGFIAFSEFCRNVKSQDRSNFLKNKKTSKTQKKNPNQTKKPQQQNPKPKNI